MINSEDMKTVIITGALGATGRELCRKFKTAGYFVVATDKKQGVCDCHFFVHVDITLLLLKEPPELFSKIVGNAISGRSLDLLILNAAIDTDRSLNDISSESFEKTISCNVIAPLMLVRQLADRLKKAGGAIIFTTSAYRKSHLGRKAEYAASKFALTGLVMALGEELKDEIRVFGVGASGTSLHDKSDDSVQFASRIADASLRVSEDFNFVRSGDVIYL